MCRTRRCPRKPFIKSTRDKGPLLCFSPLSLVRTRMTALLPVGNGDAFGDIMDRAAKRANVDWKPGRIHLIRVGDSVQR